MAFLILQIAGLGLSALGMLGALMSKKSGTGVQGIMLMTFATNFMHFLGYVLILLSKSEEAALTAYKVMAMGICFTPFMLLIFIGRFYRVKISRFLLMPLVALDVVEYNIMLTGNFSLIYDSMEYVTGGEFSYFEIEYKPVYFIFLAGTAAICLHCFKLVRDASKKNARNPARIALTVASVLIPVTSKIFSMFISKYNFSALALLFTCTVMLSTLFTMNLYEVISTARENVIETMPDALIVVDRNFKLIDLNPAAKKIFPALSSANKKTSEKFIKGIFDGGSDAEFSLNGRHYEKHLADIFDDGEISGRTALIFDISKRVLYIDELIEMRKQAEAANNAKSDFLANMSHEIRTPMNAIIGFAEICLQEKNYIYADDIKKSATDLVSIINDILDISKIEAGKLELNEVTYDFMYLISELNNMAAVQLENKENVVFSLNLDETLPQKLIGDEMKIKQVLINLLGNAIKFTRQGSVALSVKALDRDSDKISILFRVSDTGIGIKKEDMSKLFKTFQQIDTKRNREIEGTGLGLSISKALVNLMNSDIAVDSEYGKGSAFSFVLEQKIADNAAISLSSAGANQKEGAGKSVLKAPEARVLVVDDNKVNLKVTAHILLMFGIRADLADNGRRAVEMVKLKYYDIVFMDHMMPEMDGVETVRIIRGLDGGYSSELPIIALTANAVSGAKEMFLKSGMNDFISKPIQMNVLEKTLIKWLPEHLVGYAPSGAGWDGIEEITAANPD